MTAHLKFIDKDMICLQPTLSQIIQFHSKSVIEEKFTNLKGKKINKIYFSKFLQMEEINAFEKKGMNFLYEKNSTFSDNHYNSSRKKIKNFKTEEILKVIKKIDFEQLLKILNFTEEDVEIYETNKNEADTSKTNDLLDFAGFLLYRMQLLKNHQVIFKLNL